MNKPEVRLAQVNAKTPIAKIRREDLAKQIEKMRDRDSELVTGIFKNLENPSRYGGRGSVIFSYKIYPGQDTEIYELWDGERYTLPRGVARHLNNNCYYKEHQHLPGQSGEQGMRQAYSHDGRLKKDPNEIIKKIHRYAFHSLEYMDEDLEMYPSNLVEVKIAT